MDFKNFSIGTDIEENKRFENKTLKSDEKFLRRIFTQNELDYCLSKANSSQHLCARYCAKEAIVKALTSLNIQDIYYSDIEILNNKSGEPIVKIVKYPHIQTKISLSHCSEYSIANVIIFEY